MPSLPAQLRSDGFALADQTRRENHERFFKTKKGEYGEGDRFIGLTVPICRQLAKKYKNMSFDLVRTLLQSKFHEERLIALFILIYQFKKGDDEIKKMIYEAYLRNTAHVNNWDLVDSSAYQIVGAYLVDKPTQKLDQLARSKLLWDRRIAIVATYAFIRRFELDHTFHVATILLNDSHDLIHKAVGWMLREAGKRDVILLTSFLREHYACMPRTMLRYAIEKFPEQTRKQYLQGVFT